MDGLTSMDFVSVRSNSFGTAILTITMIVVLLLVLYIGIYLISKVQKSCTGAPNPPTNVEAGYVNTGDFRVQWTSVPDVDKYTIYVGQNQSFTRVQSINVTTTTLSQADVKGLQVGRTYYIVVTASNSCGESQNSAEISFVFVQPP